MRRLGVLAAGLLIPLLPAAPAFAADHTICVGSPAGPCDMTRATIALAIAAAQGNGLPDTILLGPTTFSDGPYQLNGSSEALTLKGSGPSTVITLAASASPQTYIGATRATVQDLRITMAAGSSGGDQGLSAFDGSTVSGVVVDGAGTTDATGVHLSSSVVTKIAVTMPLVASRALYSEGSSQVSDSVLVGSQGYAMSASSPDFVSRTSITGGSVGVTLDGGTINIDDSLVKLDPSFNGGIGLEAANYNNGTTPKTINADHVTIVGGGTSSIGAYAGATNPSATQHSTIQLDNSIVSGPETSLEAEAGNDGGPLAQSTATITVSYSAWAQGLAVDDPNGDAVFDPGAGNLVNDPAFVNPGGGDYRLSAASLLVDSGNPAAGGPALDLDGSARVADGDGDGTAVRDMGAYERAAVAVPPVVDTAAPQTTIVTKPRTRTTRPRVRFGFSASEHATFACKLDRHAWHPCTSPTKVRVTIGRHRFWVRATDAAGNTDPTPATYRFRRVR